MLFTIYFYIFMFTKISHTEKNHKQKTRIKFTPETL